MAKYRSAMGKSVDMTELIAKNERTRAVGNMKVNARGDTIDAYGKIVEPVTSKVNSHYAKTVGNKSAQVAKNQRISKPPRKGNDIISQENLTTVDKIELTESEVELNQNSDLDDEIEEIKAQEIKNGK